MERRSNKIIYETHSWAGVLFSIVLFIISFSGIVSLFDKELTQWERPSHRIVYDKSQSINIDRLVKPVLAAANLRQDRPILITLPNKYHPTLAVSWVDVESDKVIKEHINPVSEKVIHRQGNDFTELLRRMHTDLLLPQPFGRYFIGFMGLLMMLSILSGIIIHKKIFSEMFKFRINRSKRLLWTDFHKVLGVWPLPFHIMISFSGAMLGLAGLMINVAALSAFDGDVDAAVATVLGERVEISGQLLPDYSLDLFVKKYRIDRPKSTPTMLMIEGYGDLNQVVQVSGEKEGALVSFSNIKYRSHNHEILHINTADDATPFMLAYYALTPLHYALYGGFLIKALYFVLGLSLCLMMVSGTVIWQIRQAQRSKSV
ncbi:MAG: hypothetical protein COA95_07610 [Methylophaga sp.]|nr:MAG: hypothetical protein COA95_07610 [Methylophaga sp.]